MLEFSRKGATWPWTPLAIFGQIKSSQARGNMVDYYWKGLYIYIGGKMTCSSYFPLEFSRDKKSRKKEKRREKRNSSPSVVLPQTELE